MPRPSSAAREEKVVHEGEVHPPGWRASLGAIGHSLEMSASPGGSGGWLQMAPVRCHESCPACPAHITQAGPIFQVGRWDLPLWNRSKKIGKCDLQWHVLQDPHVSLGALSLATSFTVGLRTEITALVWLGQVSSELTRSSSLFVSRWLRNLGL